jgi:hypothetical protein
MRLSAPSAIAPHSSALFFSFCLHVFGSKPAVALAAAAAIVHVGGAEGRGELAALAGEDGDAQLPASRTLGQRSA